ncbi:MAG: flavin reductase domain-containing FMN-binding protein [Bacillota bacterium]|nr:MAG: flavin reductase domain-containing FMN-binding protein [Bacillota bacterium]MBS3950670.1 flavin reductase [Peptococcaceae bacterium]
MDLTALFKVGYGMYIVSSQYGGKLNGQIANTMFQVTAEPPTIAISVNKQNLTHELVSNSRVFSVAILSEETPMTYIGQFGFKCGRDIDKFAGIEFKLGGTGSPVPLEHALAALEAEVIAELDCGTHTLFLGKLVNAEVLAQGRPMTYAYYHEIKRGKSPKTAPTYIKPEPKVVHVIA